MVMSGDAATAAADFADAQNELKSALQGVFLDIGSKIVPALTKFIRKVIEWKPQIIAFFTRIKEAATPFFEAFKTGTEVVFPILQKFFKFIFDNKPLLIAAIAAVGIAIVVALGPGAIAVAAIVGIITIIGFMKKNWEKIWAAVANFFIGVVNKIIDGINKVTGILSKLPGVADMELQKFENVVVDAAQTTDTLTVAAEEVTPAVKEVGVAAQTATPQVAALTTSTEALATAAEKAQGRIEAWHETQEILRTGVGNLNEAVVNGTVLPTLDELIAKQEEERLKTEEVTLGIGTWASTFMHLRVLRLPLSSRQPWGASGTNSPKPARHRYGRLLPSTRHGTGSSLSRMQTVMAMDAAGVSFADIVKEMAKKNGVSTVQMAQQYATLGVKYGGHLGAD